MNGENAIYIREKPVERKFEIGNSDPMLHTWQIRAKLESEKVKIKSFINPRLKQKAWIVTVFK